MTSDKIEEGIGQDLGASADADRATHEPSPSVSALRVGISSAWREWGNAPRDRRILVSCDGRAPYPVMIAMWNPETESFSSSEPGGAGKKWSIKAWQPLPEPAPEFFCSFCGKTSDEVKKLIAGPSAFICDECVELCNDIMDPSFVPGALAQAMSARHGAKPASAVGNADAPKDTSHD